MVEVVEEVLADLPLEDVLDRPNAHGALRRDLLRQRCQFAHQLILILDHLGYEANTKSLLGIEVPPGVGNLSEEREAGGDDGEQLQSADIRCHSDIDFLDRKLPALKYLNASSVQYLMSHSDVRSMPPPMQRP